ncbi:MAG: DegT/DnrJ/EryC1/StrS family aminotransferase [Planctomycetota bacterium]|nr:DegT/DnrJ/EryC1/StrS family aminotransferase [Planctomycetota bacterium]
MKIPFHRVDTSGNELRYLREVLDSGWLTTAGKCFDFEAAFAETVDARFGIAVNSCTAALHLACEAAGVSRDSTVLVPTLTFTATAEVVEYLGGRVRLADVDPETGLLTPEIVADAIEADPSISCVMPVHFAGQACKMIGDDDGPGILEICDARGIPVIEDAAHAFPARHADGRPVGAAIGAAATCFSFYANKTITTGEGGIVTTDDEALAARMRRMRLHGIDRSAWDRHRKGGASWEYDVVAAGFKYNLSDLAAAVGLAQLERARDFQKARRTLAGRYLERLEPLTPRIRLPKASTDGDSHAWHLFVVHLDDDDGPDRTRFIAELTERGIGTSVHYRPLHRMSHWSRPDVTGLGPGFPGADAWYRGCVSLPLFPSMSDAEFDLVCEAVEQALQSTSTPS